MKENKEPKVNNAQRKALVELANRRYDALIEEARDENGQLVKQITDEVKKQLGVKVMEAELEKYKDKIVMLERAKENLGFGSYSIERGSKAEKLIESRTAKQDKEIQKLEKKRDDLQRKIWLVQTIKETEKLLKEIPTGNEKMKAGVIPHA